MIDLKFQVMEDFDRRIYESKLEELRRKEEEKNRRRPLGVRKKNWRKQNGK